jgi:pilus assembly protein CpaB
MKAARLVILGVALAAAAGAALLAGGHHEAPPPVAPPPPPLATVDILVAKNDLSRGQVIAEGDVDWQTWPAASANANFIKRTDRPDAVHQFIGAIVRESLVGGQPISDLSVVFAKGSGFMAAILPKGMRAVSMEVSAETAAGGFILPDDHVDVVLTRHDKAQTAGGAIDKIVSESILRNVRVLAIDQSKQQGTLTLALRSLVDSGSETPEGGDDQANKKPAPINTVRYGVSSVSASSR